jgi:hypothetical protein
MVLMMILLFAGFRVLTNKLRHIDDKLRAAENDDKRRNQPEDGEAKHPAMGQDVQNNFPDFQPNQEPGEVPAFDQPYPDSLNDFYKGRLFILGRSCSDNFVSF